MRLYIFPSGPRLTIGNGLLRLSISKQGVKPYLYKRLNRVRRARSS